MILHVNICFTKHCYCISLWTYYTYPVSHRYYYFNHLSPLHRYYYTWHHLCLLHIPLIHGYANSLDTIIIVTCSVHSISCSYITFTCIHWYTCMYCFYILVIWITVHSTSIIVACIFLYSCYMIVSRFFIDILVTENECYWYAMCGTKYHVDLSHGGHL